MKYSIAVLAALAAFPVAASEGHRCGLHDVNGSWVYYVFAGSPSDYTATCSFNIASGTITGTCVQSGGQSFGASGFLTVANATDRHSDRHIQRPLKSVDRSVCSITGQISYPDVDRVETLTNLTFTRSGDELIGVGTYGTGLLSATFIRSH